MFFEGLGVQYGSKIEEKSIKMGLLAPRSAVLGDLWVMLRHVGGKMATKSAKMSQHRRQEANPRGFEGSAGARDGRDTLEVGPKHWVLARGGRADRFLYSLARGFKL